MRKGTLPTLIVAASFILGACSRPPVVIPAAQTVEATAAIDTGTPPPTTTLTSTHQPVPTLLPTRTPQPTRTPKPSPTATPEVRNVLTVHLKPGLQWSDGAPLGAKDLAGTYYILWAQGSNVWNSLKDVVVRDDTTVDFLISKPSARLVYQILRSSPIAPYSQYGQWMDQTGDARKAGYRPDSPEVKKVLDDLAAFKPKSAAVSGPFILTNNPVNKTTRELIKNPKGYNAAKIDLDRIVVFFGRGSDSATMVLYNKLDYSQYLYDPADVTRFAATPNLQVIKSPTGNGPGLWFNEAVSPLDNKEVRQAFAYIIDREQIAKAAAGDAGVAVQHLAGFSDTQVEAWLDLQAISKLNPYRKDLVKAGELLKAAGCTKDANGVWSDDQGKPMAFQISVPTGNDVWIKAAGNASAQLKDFGIQASVQTYPAAQRPDVQKEGRYQILLEQSLNNPSAYPYPWFDYYMAKPGNNPKATDKLFGLKWPWSQTGPKDEQYDIPKLLQSAADKLDLPTQKPAIQTLAQIENDQLPVLALFENYTAAPVNVGTRVDGWLPSDDPIYLNGQSADNPVSIQLLDGVLKKSKKGDGSFTTVWAYPKTYDYNFNYFDRKSLVQNIGPLPMNMMFPPLFWYQWESGAYAPVLAESYELK